MQPMNEESHGSPDARGAFWKRRNIVLAFVLITAAMIALNVFVSRYQRANNPTFPLPPTHSGPVQPDASIP
ncbi:MAG: hypothetical protein H7A21_13630 [Spirochaetales bacterium]|nr:hypothetical protein [Spirochaetales bacterium]MCP5485825.1 hypothetical protein [Spirochaetales bacterium]